MSHYRLLAWEVAGFAFIVIVGIPLHSGFAWSGHNLFVAWLAPVNESTWEHFKLCFWPGVVFSLIEYRLLGEMPSSFWKAKALGLFSMPVAIFMLFYGYISVLGHHWLVLDILVFVLAVGIGQGISSWIMKWTHSSSQWWAAVILLMALAFMWFTYNPPHFFLFKDPITFQYGITRT